MDFYSAYRQGFVRVAACTLHTALADRRPTPNPCWPWRGSATPTASGSRCSRADAVGYSIEDILMQDACWTRSRRAPRHRGGVGDLMPVLVVGAPLRYRHRIYNTAVVIHRGVVLGVAPKSYLPTYREFYERRQMAPGDDVRGVIRIGGPSPRAVRPDLLFAAADIPGFVLHVEICEDMFVPIPPSARPRWRVRRCWPICPAARSPSAVPRTAACWPARLGALPGGIRLRRGGGGRIHHRSRLGRPDDDLGERRASPPPSASRRGSGARSPTSTSSCCAPSGCGWARSTTTGHHGIDSRVVPPHRVRARPAGGDIGLRREVDDFRSCRRILHGWNRIATRDTTFSVPGSSSDCERWTSRSS